MEEIDLKEMIGYFWQKKFIIILVVLLSAILTGVGMKFLIKPLYEVKTNIILTENKFENEAEVEAYTRMVDRYSVIFKSKSVIDLVIKNLKLEINAEEYEEFVENIEVVSGSYSIFVIVTNTDADKAAQIANEITKISLEKINNIYGDNKIQILDYAIAEEIPINDNLLENIIKISLISGVLIIGYLFIAYMFWDNKK